jgi:hypothetical protein
VDFFVELDRSDERQNGLEFIEGLWADKLAAVAVLCSLAIIVVSIVWCALGGDLQTVFTVMSFVLTLIAGESLPLDRSSVCDADMSKHKSRWRRCIIKFHCLVDKIPNGYVVIEAFILQTELIQELANPGFRKNPIYVISLYLNKQFKFHYNSLGTASAIFAPQSILRHCLQHSVFRRRHR